MCAANELEETIQRLGPSTVCAFIAETVVGATLGAVEPAPGYFKRIREICDKHGVLLIPGGMFEVGTNHFRIGLGRSSLSAGLAALGTFLDEVDGRTGSGAVP